MMNTATATARQGATCVIPRTDGPGDLDGPGSVEPIPVGSTDHANRTIALPGGGVLWSRRLPGAVEVRIVGDVDMFDRHPFREAFAALGSESVPFLYVLADAATFIESACLDAIAQTVATRERAGGTTVVSGLREPFATAWSLSIPRRADAPPEPVGGR